MPRINIINFYQNGLKLLFLPKKIRALGYPPHASSVWVLAPRPPQRPPSIADFWLLACMKKNLLHVTAGLHLHLLLALNMPGTFGEEDALICKRCIIRPKVFHPVKLIQKN